MAIVSDAEQYVGQMLREQLTPDHRYHNLPHTLAVVDACRLLADRLELSADDRELLELAALFHDTGFTKIYDGHERESALLAREYLQKNGYPETKIQAVLHLINITHPAQEPTNLLDKIIKDADLSNLGRTDYLATLENLRHEWKVFRNEDYKNEEWYELNYNFVKGHDYLTPPGQDLFGPQSHQNQKLLKQLAKGSRKDKKKDYGNTIISSRGAQMMFKTSLRNHLDLSNLADNKANIMLSVNALIVTIAVPMVATYIDLNPFLMPPMLTLLITCLCSMIFATLATRPIYMTGRTAMEDINAGKSNLFFFGNFYRMSIEEYDQGMREVITREDNLESSIKRDLYFLGKSLGRKYNQLRVCYNVFMFGIILTVLVFGVSYLLYKS